MRADRRLGRARVLVVALTLVVGAAVALPAAPARAQDTTTAPPTTALPATTAPPAPSATDTTAVVDPGVIDVPVEPPGTTATAALADEPVEDDAPAYLIWGLVLCALAIVTGSLVALRARRRTPAP